MEMLRALSSRTCSRRKIQMVSLDADYTASSKIDRSKLLAMRAMSIESTKDITPNSSDDISTGSGDLNEISDPSEPIGSTPDASDEDVLPDTQEHADLISSWDQVPQRLPPGLEDASTHELPLADSLATALQHCGDGDNPTPLRSHAMPFVPSCADYVSYSRFPQSEAEELPDDSVEPFEWELGSAPLPAKNVHGALHSCSGTGLLTHMVPVMQVPVPLVVQPLQHSVLPRRGRIPFTPFTGSTAPTGNSRNAGPKNAAHHKPGNSRASTKPASTEEGLKAHLRQLTFEDKDRVIMVRKISKLGLESASLLEVYFSRYGAVKKVFVSHVHEKVKGTDHVKIRPAGIAFVVFEDAGSVTAAYEKGNEQMVLGVTITIGPFESKLPKELRETEVCTA